jgi:hypothetical protein
MSKLLAHIKAMQARATAFLTPDVYVTIDGARIATGKRAKALRDDAFVNDMLRMLDGPEQREAEAEFQVMLDAVDEVQHLRNRVYHLEQEATKARNNFSERLKVEEDANNDLRSRLFDSELAYAKLRGYVERIEDERPVEMVPAPRERFLAHSPDGSGGAASQRMWGDTGRRDTLRSWYHR